MADIQTSSTSGRRKGRRLNRIAPRVDLTPMVDLAFLLITFFMLATHLETKAEALIWQKRVSAIDQEPIPECCVLNILIDSLDVIHTYTGENLQHIVNTSFGEKGIERMVKENKNRVKMECALSKSGKPYELICMIKMLPGTRYQNLTDIIDAMNVDSVAYSIQDPLREEITALQQKGN